MWKSIAGLLVAVLVYGGWVVLGASAGTHKAQAPKTMSLACAVNGSGKLQYVAHSSECPSSRGKLVKFPQDSPVRACQLIKGNPGVNKAALPPPAHPHHVAGMLFRVSGPGQCHGPKYPDSKPVLLPKAKDLKLCAGDRHGTVRVVDKFSKCNNLEFDAILKKLATKPAPQVANDAATTDEDHFKNVNVLANDPGPGPLHVSTINAAGTKGTITKNGNGTLRYDPNAKFESLKVGQTGHDSFKYRANDGAKDSAQATVSVTVTGVNDAPKATDDTGTTDKDTPITLAVLSNDTDADGDALSTASVDTTGTKGTVTINPGGTIGYDPNGQFASLGPSDTAHDTFKYKANDSHVDSNSATVDVTVTGINHAPVLSNIESAALPYDTGSGDAQITNAIEVSEPDGTTLKSATVKVSSGFNSPTDATKGSDSLSFVDELGITHLYDSSTGVLTLTSASGSSASDWQQALRDVKYSASAPTPSGSRTLSFQIDDGGTGNHLSNVVARDVTLTHVNHAPTATADTATTSEDASTVVSVLANDSDPDEDTPLHIASTDTTGTLGTVTLNPDNTFKYDPNGKFESLKPGDTATDTFKYRAADPSNSPSNEVTVTVTITGVNDAPVLAAIEGTALAYDTGSGNAQITSSTTVADVDSAKLAKATVRISLGYVNGKDTLSFVSALGITATFDASSGTLNMSSALGSSVSDWQQALHDVKFSSSATTPSGSRTISFQVDDGEIANHASNVVTRDITVNHVNHAPVATGDADSTSEDASKDVAVLPNDNDVDGDALHVSSVDTTGTLGTVTINVDNTIKYDPNGQFESLGPGDTATDTFKYKAADTSNVDSNQVTVTMTITGANDAPVLAAIEGTALAYDTGSGDKEITSSTTVADVDSANLAKATVKVSLGYLNGKDTLSFPDTATISGDFDALSGTLTLTGSDTLANYEAALHAVTFSSSATTPSGTRTISFQAFDSLAGANNASNVVTRDITVTHVNHAPVADDDTPETTEDAATDIAVLSNDSDVDGDALHVSSVDTTGTLGTVTINPDNTIKYDPNGNFESLKPGDTATDTFKYKAADTSNVDSNTGDVTITITGANDAPVLAAIEGTALPYDTGDPGSPITSTITVGDVDSAKLTSGTVKISAGYNSATDATPGSDTLSALSPQNGITSTFEASTGTLNMSSASGSTLSDWQAALRDVKFFSTGPSPSGSRTISFQVDDGEPANHASNITTRDITVTNDNVAPTDIALSQDTIASDQASGTSVGTFSTTDADIGDPHTYTLVTGTGDTDNAKFTIAGDTLKTAVVLTTGDYSIRVQTDDGRGGTFQKVFTIHAIPDAPPTDIGLTNSSVAENQPQGTDVGTLSSVDTDGGPTFTYSLVAGNGTNDADNGDFQIDNVNSKLEVSHALDFDTKAQRKIVIRTDDGKGAHFDEAFTIDVTNVNEAPTSVSLSNSSVDENKSTGTKVGDLSAIDPDAGDTVTFSLAAGVTDNNQFKIGGVNNNELQTNAVFDTETKSSYTVTVTAKDTGNLTKDQTFPITITNVNEAPVVTAGGTLNYTENQAATAIDTGITVSEPEGQSLGSASASITTGFQSGEDVLGWTDTDGPGGINLAPSTNQTINLTGAGTAAQYAAALKAVTYRNSSDAPTTADRTVTFSVTDADAAPATGSATSTVKVTAVDDPPDAKDDLVAGADAITEDANATAIPVLANDTDPDGGLKEITAIGAASNGATVTGTGGSANHWTGLTYKPAANYCNSPDSTASASPETFGYTVNGGDTATVSVTVICVNDAPTVGTDSFTGVVGNTAYVVNDPSDGPQTVTGPKKSASGDILANDSDVETPGAITIVPGSFTSTDGGSVDIEADGDFTYVSDPPEAGTGCNDTSDSFSYTVKDNDPTDPKQTTGTVNITIAGCVWYVSNSAAGNDGTSTKPYDTLAQAESSSAAGDSIFVFKGNGTSGGQNAGINLKANQKLVGEAADLVVGSDTLQSADAAKRPLISDTADDVVKLAAGNTVTGLDVDPEGAGGISGDTAAVNSGTISDVKVLDTGTAGTQPGLELNNTTGTWTISNLTVSTAGTATGVRVNNAGTANFLSSGTISITTSGGKALDATSTDLGTSVFDLLKTTASSSGGVGLVNTTGTPQLGDGSGADLDLTTSTSASAGLLLLSAGGVTLPTAGTSEVHADGGPAVDVQSTPAVNVALDTAESTNSTTDGINWDSNTTGTFSADSGGTNGIKGAQGIAVDVNGGSGDFTYPGKLDNGTGATADITNRSGGGTVLLSGAITDSSDAGGGITLSGNTAGATTFNNGTKTINTTTGAGGDAVTIAQPDNSTHTVTFSGGGLNIDTAAGKGFEATGVGATPDGTLVVSGSGNSIATGTGRALSVDNAAIGSGVGFHDVSSNGASNGIRINNTGNGGGNGGLTVTGDGTSGAQGGDNSGGTIQQSTGTGVFLSNTKTPSFTNLKVDTSGHGGVTGSTGVHSLSFDRGRIVNSGHKSGVTPDTNRDAAFDFTDLHGAANPGNNLDGVLTVTDNVLSDNWGGNVHVSNSSGTISNAVITGNATSNTPSDSTVATGVKMTLQGNGASVPNLTKADIGNNDFFHPRNSGITIQGGGAAVGGSDGQYGDPDNDTDVISIHNNLVRGGTPDGITNPAAISTQGILVSLASRGEGHADISNNGTIANPITNTVGSGVGAGAAGSMRALFNIAGNRISANNFGGAQGISVEADKDGSGNNNPRLAASITGNTTSNTDGPGLWANMHDTNGSMLLQIGTAASGNTFNSPTPHAPDGFEPGLQVSNGSAGNASFNPTTCTDIRNNTVGASPEDPAAPGYHDPGIDLFKRSSSSTTYIFGIVGLAPSPATAAQTETYVALQNPNSAFGGGSSATKKVLVVAGSNFTSCTLPNPLRPAP